MSSVPSDLVELGRVVSAYGVRGWVKIRPYAAGGDTLLKVNQWWLKAPTPPSQQRTGVFAPPTLYRVEQSREHSGTVVARFQNFDDRDLAEALKAYTVWVSRQQFPSADNNEHYWVDLIDCLLYGENENGESQLIGQVQHVFDNGAHAVLEVVLGTLNDQQLFTPSKNAKGRLQTTLVPFVEAHVHTVDTDNQRLLSNWPIDS